MAAGPDRSPPNYSIQQTDHASSAEPNTSTQVPMVQVAKQYSFPAPCCSFMGMAQRAFAERSVSSPSLNQDPNNQLLNQQYYSIQTPQPSMVQVVQPKPPEPEASMAIQPKPSKSTVPAVEASPQPPAVLISIVPHPNSPIYPYGFNNYQPHSAQTQLSQHTTTMSSTSHGSNPTTPSSIVDEAQNTTKILPKQDQLPRATPNCPNYKASKTKGILADRAGKLANLLPTGTVLAFQALIPSLSNDGRCEIFNRYLVGLVIAFCGLTCFLSNFTDSFKIDKNNDPKAKVYYGFATPKGLCIFNDDYQSEEEKTKVDEQAKKHKIIPIDFVHAFCSLFVFLVFAICSADVLDCYFPKADDNQYSMIIYLPLVAGVLSSFLFSFYTTNRKGIGIADNDERP